MLLPLPEGAGNKSAALFRADGGCMKQREPLDVRMKRFEQEFVNRSDRLFAGTSEAARPGVEADDCVRAGPGRADRTIGLIVCARAPMEERTQKCDDLRIGFDRQAHAGERYRQPSERW